MFVFIDQNAISYTDKFTFSNDNYGTTKILEYQNERYN